jgi:hypothetical protein
MHAETTATRRRSKGGPRGGREKSLCRFGELPVEPQGVPTGPADDVPAAGRLTPLAFDFEALDRLIAAADEQTRHVRRLLTRVAAGEPPYSEPQSAGTFQWKELSLFADPGSPRPSINQLEKPSRTCQGMLAWSLGPHWQAGVSPPLLPSACGDDYAAARRRERLARVASGSGSDRLLPRPIDLANALRFSA